MGLVWELVWWVTNRNGLAKANMGGRRQFLGAGNRGKREVHTKKKRTKEEENEQPFLPRLEFWRNRQRFGKPISPYEPVGLLYSFPLRRIERQML